GGEGDRLRAGRRRGRLGGAGAERGGGTLAGGTIADGDGCLGAAAPCRCTEAPRRYRGGERCHDGRRRWLSGAGDSAVRAGRRVGTSGTSAHHGWRTLLQRRDRNGR